MAVGIIAYPTEAVFGLGCNPLNPEAVHNLLALKQRPMDKGLILIAADIAQLTPFISSLTAEAEAQLAKTWPGPHTWLLPAHTDTPPMDTRPTRHHRRTSHRPPHCRRIMPNRWACPDLHQRQPCGQNTCH